jgi:hypothetical protein
MNVATIGFDPNLLAGDEPVRLLSEQHIAHFEAIVATPEAVISEYFGGTISAGGLGTQHQQVLDKHKTALLPRLQVIRDLVEAGSYLVVLLQGPFPSISIPSQGSVPIRVYDWIWFLEKVKLKPLSGRGTVYCGPELRPAPMSKNLNLGYSVSVDVPNSVPFLSTPALLAGQAGTVGTVRRFGKGAVIFAPMQTVLLTSKPETNTQRQAIN